MGFCLAERIAPQSRYLLICLAPLSDPWTGESSTIVEVCVPYCSAIVYNWWCDCPFPVIPVLVTLGADIDILSFDGVIASLLYTRGTVSRAHHFCSGV